MWMSERSYQNAIVYYLYHNTGPKLEGVVDNVLLNWGATLVCTKLPQTLALRKQGLHIPWLFLTLHSYGNSWGSFRENEVNVFHIRAPVWSHGDLTSLTHLPLRNGIYSQSLKTRQAYACFNNRVWPRWCSVTSKARAERSCDSAWLTVRSLSGEAMCRLWPLVPGEPGLEALPCPMSHWILTTTW